MEEIDSAELTEWIAFDRIEPFGDAREDLRMGILASCVVNHSMSPPKSAARPIDFMPFRERKDEAPVLLADPQAQSKLIERRLRLVDTGSKHGVGRPDR